MCNIYYLTWWLNVLWKSSPIFWLFRNSLFFSEAVIILEAFAWRCSMEKVFLQNFTGKRLCQSLFFNKVAALRPATLLKDRLCHRCFPVNFSKFLTLVQDKRLFFFQILSVNLSVSAFRSIPSLRVKQVCKIFFYYVPFSKVLRWSLPLVLLIQKLFF